MSQLFVNRNRVKRTFADYTAGYDPTDPKVRLKIQHTYKVAELCETIAKAQGMEEADLDLAWLLGMLHDVGRFEQLRCYGTFLDAKSVDHAEYGADLLFQKGRVRDYLDETKEDSLIETAIRLHNKYQMPEQMEVRERLFSNILRDGDKIDILRVNVETPLEDIYDVSPREFRQAVISPEVMQAFEEHHTVLRDLMATPVDHLVGHIAFAYELVFPVSIQLVQEQGYLEQMMQFQSDREETRKQFCRIRQVMKEYLCRKA